MATPLKERWFDDYQVGEVFEFGNYAVSEAEIIAFARSYDSQFFHLDSEAAKSSSYGGLIASGWMSAAIAMRMMCDHFVPETSGMGSPGIDQLRWLVPVRPGDQLHLRASVMEVKRSQSKPDRGVVTIRQELINQLGQVVMSLDGKSMHKVRPPCN